MTHIPSQHRAETTLPLNPSPPTQDSAQEKADSSWFLAPLFLAMQNLGML